MLKKAFLMMGLVAAATLAMANEDAAAVSGATELTLEVTADSDAHNQEVVPTEDVMQRTCAVLDRRLKVEGIRGAQIQHANGKIMVRIPHPDSAPAAYQEKIAAVEKILTLSPKLEFLAVYPESEQVIRDEETQKNIQQYERDRERYNADAAAGNLNASKPAYPDIPAKMGLNDYCILPYHYTDDLTGEPVLDRFGKPAVVYIVLQKPHAAMQKNIYISNTEVVKVSLDYVRKGYVDVVLSREGADRMSRLTGSMQLGRDRLAVVLNNQVVCAPIVQAVLHRDFVISGLNGKGEALDIANAMTFRLPVELKVTERK